MFNAALLNRALAFLTCETNRQHVKEPINPLNVATLTLRGINCRTSVSATESEMASVPTWAHS